MPADPPICGVCKRYLRPGEQPTPIRLKPGERSDKNGQATEPGLYASCEECVDTHRGYIASELGVKPAEVSRQMMQ